ncbi:alpha/beta fold hydrolase [Pontibacter arcticus]|uniref:Alpha/beta hydrolase n=1 Tax=Pontibacter arcticus TaxID=2080288 RepID=A0A364RBP7_9BACT|nr:alpha/beta hydrolase [Pontibacter arcticus]RAU81713.1 alpha/beta hydrolase [Pontibacter arcticus]
MKKLATSLFLLFFMLANQPLLHAQSTSLVSVGDHSLEMIQAGAGDYTVIFESGFGMDYKVWGNVASEIMKTNKVLLYSRAGTGKSEPNPKTQTLEQAVNSLATLLEKANAQPPYILVGHSYGGFIIRAYAAQNPGKVKGLVFVDPSHEKLMAALKKADPAKAAKDTEAQNQMMPAQFKAENDYINLIFEKGALPDFGTLPAVPAVVLTSVQKREKPDLFLHEPLGITIWRKLHADLFAQFTDGAHYVTTRSGHNIHRTEPELVVQAIKQVITLADKAKAEQAYALKMQQLESKLKEAEKQLKGKKPKTGETLVFAALQDAGFDESTINGIGYHYLGNPAATPLAVAILKYNTVAHTGSANAYDSYGEALLAQGQLELARIQFIKAIELATATDNQATIRNSKANLEKIESRQKLAKKK